MAEQVCTRLLHSLVQLVHHRRSFLLAFRVLNFVCSVVAILENLLVIRALMKGKLGKNYINTYCESKHKEMNYRTTHFLVVSKAFFFPYDIKK